MDEVAADLTLDVVSDGQEVPPSTDDIDLEIDKLKNDISFLEEIIDEVTYDSFIKVIKYYERLLRMNQAERTSDNYGLTSTYALLLLNSTYDVAIKEVFKKKFESALLQQNSLQQYIGGILDRKILNRYMTNIKHKLIKETFGLVVDTQNARLQYSISIINDLIETRNKIAHGLETSSKGHHDLNESLISVITYLKWYSTELEKKFTETTN
ncbi:HEPN domain-containing protein [Lysinibacillus capsici]|uniref:HEPN domain-containing protein n=1 Tax=Lysinibacillus capsici TaxID=2115968 RepID=UPI003F1EEF5B